VELTTPSNGAPVNRIGSLLIRWLRYNAVGIGGFTIQLCVLWLLVNVVRVQYIPATVCAVEAALLHNFFWHEHWTWRGLAANTRWQRLLRFNTSGGLLCLVGNTLITSYFKQYLGLPLLVANIFGSAITGLLNFAISSCWIFVAHNTDKKRSDSSRTAIVP
jgi:putative flippase GtrA